MARALAVGRLYVVTWDVRVTLEDQQQALAGLRAATQAAGAPFVMVLILGASLHPPEAEVRRKGTKVLREALEVARALEVVVAGEGVLGSLQRSTARGLSVLLPELRGRLFVQDSLRAAVHHAGTFVPVDEAAVIPALTRAGFPI